MTKKKENAEQRRIRALLAEIGNDPAIAVNGLSGVPAIADALEMTHQGVYKWCYSGKISLEGARKIETLTKKRFDRELLCPWAFQ